MITLYTSMQIILQKYVLDGKFTACCQLKNVNNIDSNDNYLS